MGGRDEPDGRSCPAPSGCGLWGRWDDLHPEDQEFAVMALAAMGDVLDFGEWEVFVDLALDLRPAVEREMLTIAEVRLLALVLLDHAADGRRPRHPEIRVAHLLASATDPSAPPVRDDHVDPEDLLVGTSDIAERLGLASSSVVRSWRRRSADFLLRS